MEKQPLQGRLSMDRGHSREQWATCLTDKDLSFLRQQALETEAGCWLASFIQLSQPVRFTITLMPYHISQCSVVCFCEIGIDVGDVTIVDIGIVCC